MTMQRRHFEAVAALMKEATGFAIYKTSKEARTQHALTCNTLAIGLGVTNAQFNRVRFLKACGLDEETVDAL